ncbi:hypothetical protein L211DRAFT_834515 [Terfezia boudieri ATCC MYA-4762]|uniref:GAF domain-containing protein n=1 Tax=Terfezia boudieri ATCC MYA-4762 TaxID=1051890 RepID=A0A3N4LXR3_9PEZI|nr:hypothetical protein L211DRAFT_834515 [Terfezia boudieri ATCC MYA-4762]
MMDQSHLRTRVPATLNRLDSKDSFLHWLLNRKSRSGKSTSSQQDCEYGQFPDAPVFTMTPSPNTHPLLTKPFPRDEVLGGASITAAIPGLGWRTGAGPLTQRYASWHSHLSPNITDPRSMIGQETISSKFSRKDSILEWDFFVKCYSEGRFNLSNPPEPPSQRPRFQYFSAPIPIDEDARLKAVKSCNLPLTIHAIEKCHRLVVLAKKVFLTKMGAFSLIDESHEIFKVEDFIGRSDISRHLSIGAHILLSSEPIIVLDTVKDWRFQGNPIVTGAPWVRFYAGAPIVTSNGEIVGVFAVFDTQPRESFTMASRRKLMDFARLVMVELELMMDEKDTLSRPRPLCFLRDSKVTTPALPSREEREAVRARLLQSMESDSEMTKSNNSTLIGRSHQDVLAATRAAQSGGYTNLRTTTLTLPRPAITRRYELSGMGKNSASFTLSLGAMGHQSPPSTPGLHSSCTAQMTLDRAETPPATPSSTKKALHRENYSSSLGTVYKAKISNRTSPKLDISSGLFSPKTYDEASFATSIISRCLGFDLVYLLRVCPIRSDICDSELSGHGLHTQILASHGMPKPEPAFDGTLHLRALRSDGGLAYSNQNKVPKDEGCGYQTGVLLPLHRENEDFDWYEGGGGTDTLSPLPLHGIVTKSPLCRRGIVLCGFTWAVGESSSFSSEKVRLFREFGWALWDTLSQREV